MAEPPAPGVSFLAAGVGQLTPAVADRPCLLMTTALLRACLLLVLLGVLPLGCCRQATRDYLSLQGLDLALTDAAGSPLLTGTRTSAPEVLATLHLQVGFIAQRGGAPFMGQAQALQCAEEGSKGLKAAVSQVVLTSTGLFNGHPAGQSLNAFVRCDPGSGRPDFPLSQLADSLNTKTWQRYGLYAPLVLHISPKPLDNMRQQFELQVRLAGAPPLTQRTVEFIWD